MTLGGAIGSRLPSLGTTYVYDQMLRMTSRRRTGKLISWLEVSAGPMDLAATEVYFQPSRLHGTECPVIQIAA